MTRSEFLLKLLEMECLRIDKTPSRLTIDISNVEEEETLRVNILLNEEGNEDYYSILKWNDKKRWHQVTRDSISKSSYGILYDYIMLNFEDRDDQEEENDEYIKKI